MAEFTHKFLPSGRRIFLALHGTGGDENDLIPLAKEIDEKASILSPRGRVLENGMPRFFRRFAEGVFDIEDLKFRTQELAEFVVASSREYKFQLSDVIALGYSNGANIAASLLLLRPDVLSSAILFRATLPLEAETLPDLSGKKVFISAGKYDQLIPGEGTIRLEELLKKCHAQVELHWQESNHGLVSQDVIDAKRWLQSL
ncbi:MAG: alpha/beta hydrolase [Nitrososphaerales archaeon]